jgi:hypothetical protein
LLDYLVFGINVVAFAERRRFRFWLERDDRRGCLKRRQLKRAAGRHIQASPQSLCDNVVERFGGVVMSGRSPAGVRANGSHGNDLKLRDGKSAPGQVFLRLTRPSGLYGFNG